MIFSSFFWFVLGNKHTGNNYYYSGLFTIFFYIQFHCEKNSNFFTKNKHLPLLETEGTDDDNFKKQRQKKTKE